MSMSNFRFCPFVAAVVALTAGSVFAQEISLTVNQSESFVDIVVLAASDSSSISGTGLIELDPASEPFSTVRITDLNLTLADGFSINLLGGAVIVSVGPDGANVAFTEAGPATTVAGNNEFLQTGNVFGVTGVADIMSLFGNDTMDLGTVDPVSFDVAAQLSVDGDTLTVTSNINLDFEFEALPGTEATLNVSGPIVLSGILPEDFTLGDVNCDGIVDLLDVAPFVELLLNGGFSVKADLNSDGVVDLLDVAPFVELLLN